MNVRRWPAFRLNWPPFSLPARTTAPSWSIWGTFSTWSTWGKATWQITCRIWSSIHLTAYRMGPCGIRPVMLRQMAAWRQHQQQPLGISWPPDIWQLYSPKSWRNAVRFSSKFIRYKINVSRGTHTQIYVHCKVYNIDTIYCMHTFLAGSCHWYNACAVAIILMLLYIYISSWQLSLV